MVAQIRVFVKEDKEKYVDWCKYINEFAKDLNAVKIEYFPITFSAKERAVIHYEVWISKEKYILKGMPLNKRKLEKTSDKGLLEKKEMLTETNDPKVLKYNGNIIRYVCKNCGFARRKFLDIKRHQEKEHEFPRRNT